MKKNENKNELSLMIMMGFFIISFLLLVLFGTKIYQSISKNEEESALSRTLSSYLHTASKMNEAGIYTEEKEGKLVLVVKDGDTGFGNRIYLHEGYLVEDFGKLDDGLNASSALQIGETSLFEVEKISESLLKISTSDGQVYISLFEKEDR
ncbi:MAG: DUF4860 domain-containing protein [Erysipelotrichaceae bacterium]|nr:DUF4860 domain-containing protein [Erysipelotrichaceae bacterium]